MIAILTLIVIRNSKSNSHSTSSTQDLVRTPSKPHYLHVKLALTSTSSSSFTPRYALYVVTKFLPISNNAGINNTQYWK